MTNAPPTARRSTALSELTRPDTGKLVEIGRTSRGYTIYREPNEAGGHRYWSDAIGGGVVIHDSSLASPEEVLFALRADRELHRKAAEGEPDGGWDGVPPVRPHEPGWHVLRRKPGPYLRDHEIDEELVFHYDATRTLPWERTENGLRCGHREQDIAWSWSYVTRLEPAADAALVVPVPRAALDYLLQHGRFNDDGPLDFPIMSTEMRAAYEAVQGALAGRKSPAATIAPVPHWSIDWPAEGGTEHG